MQHLDAVLIFAKVVEHGSFAAAGRALRQPKATVSRKMAELEQALGVRLLNRTTRALSLTDVGRRYLEHARRIAGELEAAQRSISESRAEPSGLVRLTAPLALSQGFLSPILAEYSRTYPKVRIALEAANRRVDIVDEGFDLALRVGAIADSQLIVRRLGIGHARLFATRAYLESAGTPLRPDDLADHALIDDGLGSMPTGTWSLKKPGAEIIVIKVAPRLAGSDAGTALIWGLAGCGIVRLPTFVAAPHLTTGALVPILPDWTVAELDVNLIFPSTRGITPAVRHLIDLLVEQIRPQLQQ
jgi:DNA-binding transcriptional LysR family regulator